MRTISEKTYKWLDWRHNASPPSEFNLDERAVGYERGAVSVAWHILCKIDSDNPTAQPLDVMIARLEAMYGDGVRLDGGKHNSPYHITDTYQVLGRGETPEDAWTMAYEDMRAKINNVFEIN